MPGGSQALHRTELVTVAHEDRTGPIPRPSLLAAIVAKAAALDLPGDPARHHRDLALLLYLLPDPFEAREQTGSKDPRRLRAAIALLDEDHIAWTLAPTARREAGHAALRILLDATGRGDRSVVIGPAFAVAAVVPRGDAAAESLARLGSLRGPHRPRSLTHGRAQPPLGSSGVLALAAASGVRSRASARFSPVRIARMATATRGSAPGIPSRLRVSSV